MLSLAALLPLAALAAPAAHDGDGTRLFSGMLVLGARGEAEVRQALLPRVDDLAACAEGVDFDVTVEVRIEAAGGVSGVSVVAFAPGSARRLALPCLQHAVEPIALRDRGREPPTQVLLRFSDVVRPPLPWLEIRRALKRSQPGVARCVTHLRRSLPGLRGVVVAELRFVDDRVDDVGARGEQGALFDCVKNGLGGVVVDGVGTVTVVAPFAFDDDRDVPIDARSVERRTFFDFVGCDLPIP